MPPYDDDDGSWPAMLYFANEVALAYRRQNAKLRDQLAEKDRAIEFYRKMIADNASPSDSPSLLRRPRVGG